MKPMLDELDQDRLVRYDIDEATNERAQYDVRAVPTLILVNETGEELQRLVGSQPLSKLQDLLNV
jgi:thioredoxin-like negative regulator of GroEL